MRDKNDIKKVISVNLKEIRISKGLSQDELAERSGVISQTISNIERNIVWPKDKTLNRIADALDISSDQLFRQNGTAQIEYWEIFRNEINLRIEETLEKIKPKEN